ncbi:hypothetical protein OIDMADRAFT_29930 [Oidiodendron maius Zn]|uniref:Uncharacterized protein n=1 Tax=Oidiodendron maius (strain Zn) TaxID=913774 RepID=A0A0C3H898_OIDMZ|nr:hypothetical protein OIDMADRAFT_29930 [Oidiodendron maius Zn]
MATKSNRNTGLSPHGVGTQTAADIDGSQEGHEKGLCNHPKTTLFLAFYASGKRVRTESCVKHYGTNSLRSVVRADAVDHGDHSVLGRSQGGGAGGSCACATAGQLLRDPFQG